MVSGKVFWQCCSWIHAFNGQKDGDFTDAKTLATTSNSTQVAILVDLNQTAIGAEPGVPTLFDVKVRSSVSGGVWFLKAQNLVLIRIQVWLLIHLRIGI
jgi:hypothetical protein